MNLEKYKKFFLNGDWHTHSTFSDGENTPEEIVKTAISLKLGLIAITDHVNKKTNWLDDFKIEIDRLKNKYHDKIVILSGFEAKAINLQGDIDARLEFYEKVDIILGAIHRIPTKNGFIPQEEISSRKDEAFRNWRKTMISLINNPNADIIAHPTNLLLKHDIIIPTTTKKEIAELAKQKNKIFEINVKYQVPDKDFFDLLKENDVPLVIGTDAHNIEELKKYNRNKSCF